MKSKEFIAFSACSMMLTAVGIDIMLPVFGEVSKHYGLKPDSPDTAFIVTYFFWGQVAQILFGLLSDRYGRLPILRLGFPLYIIAGVCATYAPDLHWMFIARFFAGIGASAVFMTTIAGVRDRFSGDVMARKLSFIFTIFLFTPVVAPFLGLTIQSLASWRAVFLTPPAFAVFVFIWSFRMEESHPEEKRNELNVTSILNSIRTVLTNKTFLRYTAITTILFAGISSYVSSSAHIVNDLFHKPGLFAFSFACVGAVMAMGALANSRLALKFGARKTIKSLLIAYVLIALLLLFVVLISGFPPDMLFFFVCIAGLLGINLAIEPNSSALAMEPMGHHAGIASALYGTCFFFIGAFLGSVISFFLTENVMAMVIGFVVIGIGALLLVLTDKTPVTVSSTA